MRSGFFSVALSCIALGPLAGCDSSSGSSRNIEPGRDAGDNGPGDGDFDSGTLPAADAGNHADASGDGGDGGGETDAAPAAPSALFAVAEATQVTLSWSEAAGATSYDIYWGTAAGITTASTKIVGASSPYVHSDLTTDTTYFYRVVAVHESGEILSEETSVRAYALTGAFKLPAEDMNQGRHYHAATRLADGQVLITGGQGTDPGSAELYDPSTRNFTSLENMRHARQEHTSTLLADGTVLLVGGLGGAMESAELFDPETKSFTSTGSMREGRRNHAAVLLDSGKVLIVGGTGDATDELFDPAVGSFTEIASNTGAVRRYVTATKLADGRVLVVGGAQFDADGTGMDSAFLYDAVKNTYAATGSLSKARLGHTATLLPSGKVLIAGGMSTAVAAPFSDAEIYDPKTGKFSAVASEMSKARGLLAATLLPNGKVLVVGGYPGNAGAPSAVDLFDPLLEEFVQTGYYSEYVYALTATTLLDGTALVTGGYNIFGSRKNANIFY